MPLFLPRFFLLLRLSCLLFLPLVAKTQTLADAANRSRESWQRLRTACAGNYTYTLYELRYDEKKRNELTVWVVQNKVDRTRLLSYDLATEKAQESRQKHTKLFMSMPVGTLDDIYLFAEKTIQEQGHTPDYVLFDTDHLRLIQSCGYYPEGQLHRPFRGYFIKNIEILPTQQKQLCQTWQLVDIWQLDSSIVVDTAKVPTQIQFYPDGHITFQQKEVYCYEHYHVDLLEQTLSINEDYTPREHYECEGLKNSTLLDQTYIRATRYRFQKEHTELWLYAPTHALRLRRVE